MRSISAFRVAATDPAVASATDLNLVPALTLRAPLTSVKVIEEGTPASYGGTWVAPTRRWVGLVPLGYGDGILRSASNRARVTVHTACARIRSAMSSAAIGISVESH